MLVFFWIALLCAFQRLRLLKQQYKSVHKQIVLLQGSLQEKAELELKAQVKGELKDTQEFVGKLVETGTNSTEKIHKTLTKLPLDLLESLSPLKKTTKRFRKLHDQSVDQLYHSVREVKKHLDDFTDELFEEPEKRV